MAKIIVSNVRLSSKEGSCKAFANIDISGVIEIYGCKLMDGQNGTWVSMPQRKGKDDKWYDEVRIKSDDVKKQIHDAFTAAYIKAKTSQQAGAGGTDEESPF